MPQELVAIMGDRESPRVTLEQHDAKVVFQFFQRFGDRGLGDRQVLRRARDRALFGNGDKILNLAKREGHGILEHGLKRSGKLGNGWTFFGILPI
jgi:hypothetical protein